MLQKLHNLKQCSDIGRSVLLYSWFGNIKSPNFPCTKLSISEKKNSSRSLGLSYLFLTLYTNNNPHSETEFPHFPENKISWIPMTNFSVCDHLVLMKLLGLLPVNFGMKKSQNNFSINISRHFSIYFWLFYTLPPTMTFLGLEFDLQISMTFPGFQ